MPLLVVILIIILGVIVVIAIINALWRLHAVIFYSSRPRKLNESCAMTSDCHQGLTCDQSLCLIPITGSCVNREDLCSQGGVCSKGMCIIEVEPSLSVKSQLETETPVAHVNKTPVIEEELDPAAFHSLRLENGTLIVEKKNILDASIGTEKDLIFVWYATFSKINKNTSINVVHNKNTISSIIPNEVTVVSCQAFGRICYILVRGLNQQYAIQKYVLTLEGKINVEYPQLPPYPDVAKCVNLGVSDKNVIMIVTEESIISFNTASLNTSTSSWYINKRNNSNILYMNHINGMLFSISQENWYYGSISGFREENTYPVVGSNGVVNKPYWAKKGLRLS